MKPIMIAIVALWVASLPGQQPQPVRWTAAEDHRNMMDQLGIKALRPGPSGNESAPNHANYDETVANPFPNLPDVLTLKNGKKVTTPQEWWTRRRAEIIEDFEREVLGRVPKGVPRVSWSVTSTVEATIGSHHVIGRQLTGHVDNSSYPEISVEIQMIVVTPADAKSPVPVMMLFGRGFMPGSPPPPPPGPPRPPLPPPPPGSDPPSFQQLIADGWGYAFINPVSVQ